MKYLVDVNVISEATKPRPDAGVVAWLRKHEAELVLDPVVLGEIRLGILLLVRRQASQRLGSMVRSTGGIDGLPALGCGHRHGVGGTLGKAEGEGRGHAAEGQHDRGERHHPRTDRRDKECRRFPQGRGARGEPLRLKAESLPSQRTSRWTTSPGRVLVPGQSLRPG